MTGPLDHAAAIGAKLDQLDVQWALGGSVAASLIGEPRSTNDVDLALRLAADEVASFCDALGSAYYAPLDALADAAERHDSFNIIHLESGFKVDLFFLGNSTLDRWQIERREQVSIEGVDYTFWITSTIDLVLRKLWWFRLGGEVSDRQWNDVLSILRVQRPFLDLDRLRADATITDLRTLVDRALSETR